MEKEILTLEEAAELFGVSVKTFIKLLKEETIPARKIGREWRFSRKALIEWLSSGNSQDYSSSEKDVKDFFDNVAPEWEKIRENLYDESIKDKLININILDKDKIVVDLGAGDGFISRSVSGYVKKVIAVDLSSEMLKQLNIKARSSGINNIETIEGDGLDLPLEDSSVDVVCANMFLHHIDSPELAIREMHRVLKPCGMVYIADFHEHSNIELTRKMHDIWPGFKSNEITAWFGKNGFKNIQIDSLINDKQSKDKIGIFTLTAVK
ncbi:MAG TPA: methyltransferase domain-containing protein [Clostridiaceae bacterium]|nr:methyltransferase domain-containing protein [Clostridiaceae bacterium]